MNHQDLHITGIILAGGHSTRMGMEKGLVMFNGKTFIQHIIDAVQPFVQDLIIVSNAEVYDSLGYKRVEDMIKNTGPLAGLYTGLHNSESDINLVVSCDVPLINKTVLQLLINAYSAEQDIIQCQSQEKIMPLIALYRRSCKNACLELLETGERRLMELSRKVKTTTLLLDTSLDKYVQNINTKEQLKAIQHEYTT